MLLVGATGLVGRECLRLLLADSAFGRIAVLTRRPLSPDVRSPKLETHVVEFAPRLMPRQLDDAGSKILVRTIESLGVQVHLNKATKRVTGNSSVEGLVFTDDETLAVEMIIVSAGIRPRDELAREAGLDVGERGGVRVNDGLLTSDPDIYAIGEVALCGGMIYGLVAPGYEMAEVVAANLAGERRRFDGCDLSTKLKLMGVDVASFGDCFADEKSARPITYEDPFTGVYKKLLFSPDGTRLVGGILVGDASDYATLLARRYGDRVKRFATFNEPSVLTLFGYGFGWDAPPE